MANKKHRPRHGTATQAGVETLMVALHASIIAQVRAETAEAVNLGLRRHDARYHTPGVVGILEGDPPYDQGVPSLYVPEPSKLVGLNGEPL